MGIRQTGACVSFFITDACILIGGHFVWSSIRLLVVSLSS